MKKKYVVISLLFIAIFALLNPSTVNSRKIEPIPGVCDDPTSPITCAQGGCHPSPAQASTNALLTLLDSVSGAAKADTLSSSFQYLPNTTYFLTFQLHTDSSMNGFEMTALNSSNNMAGAFTITDANHTAIQSITNIEYISHLNATAFDSWQFEWTSPSYSAAPVTFYFTYNTSSAFQEAQGVPDGVIYKGSITISASTAGIEDVPSYFSNLHIFPDPVSNEFALSFSLERSGEVNAAVYTADGRLVKQLMNSERLNTGKFNRSFDISALAAGIYLVKLDEGGSGITKKIIKL